VLIITTWGKAGFCFGRAGEAKAGFAPFPAFSILTSGAILMPMF